MIFSIGVIGTEFINEEDSRSTEEDAIKLAYNRSLLDNRVHTVSTTGEHGELMFVAWGGHVLRKHL